MSHKTTFVGREKELSELRMFINSPTQVLLVVVGTPGMGKSALVKQFSRIVDSDKSVWFVHLFDIDRNQSVEDLASELNHNLLQGKHHFWWTKNQRKLTDIASAIPKLGPFIQVLMKDKHKNERSKLIELLKMLGKKTEQKIVLIGDPYDYLEKVEYEEFFMKLTRILPDNVKIIIPQRPTDILAASERFLSLARVRRTSFDLGCLPKIESIEMTKSLLPKESCKPEILEGFWDQYKGWPFLIYMSAIEFMINPHSKRPLQINSIENLCTHILQLCPNSARNLIFSISLVPLGIYQEDLLAFSGLKPEDYAIVMEDHAVKQTMVKEEKFGKMHVRLFHVTFRDFVQKHMRNVSIDVKLFKKRLFSKILDDVVGSYRDYDILSVAERDATTLVLSRKIFHYKDILEPSEELEKICECMLKHVKSLRVGGRSYALYSLLILAKNGSFVLPSERIEDALMSLYNTLSEDSFLHPQYAVILMGNLLIKYPHEIHMENKRTCVKRIKQLTEQTKRTLLAETASRVDYGLSKNVDPLQVFELDELLPVAYLEDGSEQKYDYDIEESETRSEVLSRTSVSEWTVEDHEFMYGHIKHIEKNRTQ